jgi:hypothetical protein
MPLGRFVFTRVSSQVLTHLVALLAVLALLVLSAGLITAALR